MGLGKTYSADYLIDSNGNTGVSGQVLISTATGIDWADGTAITGGPFLPLSAGSSYPLTNSLYLENTSGSAGASPSLYFKNGSGNFWRYLHESGGDFSIKEGTATRLTFKSGGYVGIGTTSPASKLHVQSSTSDGVIVRTSTNVEPFIAIQRNSGSNGVAVLRGIDSGHLYVDTGATGAAQSTKMTITAGGNVGIGTTSPSYGLDVNHSAARIGSSSQTTTSLYLTATNTAGAPAVATEIIMQGYEGRAKGTFYTDSGVDGEWFNGVPYNGNHNYWQVGFDETGGQAEYRANSILTVRDNGNVGIGTNNPTNGKLVIDSTANQIAIETGTAGDGRLNIGHFSNGTFIGTYGDDGGAADIIRFGTHSGDERMRITSAGRVGIGTTSPAYHIHGLSAESGWGYSFQNATGDEDVNVYMSHGGGYGIAVDSTEDASGKYLLKLSGGTGGGTGIGSVVRMIVTAAGNVGIGTTSPVDELHVEGVIQSKKQLLPSTSSTAGWYKIGTMSGFVQGGATAVLEIAGHQGYNATNNQDYLIKLFIKTSNGNAGGPNGQGFNSWYERTGGNNATIEFKWNNSATNDYDLYMFIPTHSLRSWYSVKKGTGTWEHAGTSATDPGANSSAVLKATGLFNILDANVGIGTAAPGAKLQIGSAAYAPNANLSNNLLQIKSPSGFAYLTIGNGDVANSTSYIGGASGFIVLGSVTDAGAMSEHIRMTNTGNVGIGTTSPGEKLQVNSGNIKVEGGAASSIRGLIIAHTGQTGNQTLLVQNSTNSFGHLYTTERALRIEAGADGGTGAGETLDFWVNGSERMMIDTSGNVGIGTTSPAQKLHVSGGHILLDNNEEIRQKDSGGTERTVFELDSANDLNIGGSYAGALKFIGGGSYAEVMRIHDDGNVGIGTTAPLRKLDLIVDATTDAVRIKNTNSNGGGLSVFAANGGGGGNRILTLGDSSENVKVAVIESGNVGIGTTAPDAPLHILKAAGGANIVTGLKLDPDDATANSGISIDFNASTTNTGASLVGSRIVGAREGGNASGFLALYTSPDASGSVPLERMRITSGGNVGIGTTSPAAKLDVNGDIAVKGASIINKASAALTIGDIAGNDSVTNLTLTTAGRSTEVFLDDSGNVGVNTATPSYNLTVDSGANDIGIVTASSDSGSYVGFLDNATSTIPKVGAVGNKLILDASQYVGVRKTNPSYALDVNGTIRATGNVIAYSDARVKENVETIPNALDKVKSMRGVGYNKIGEEKRSIGVIAQEMLEVMPEVVSQDEQGMYSVAYGNLVGILIEAVKEQQQQIDELKKQIK